MSIPQLIDIAYAQFGEKPLVNDSGIPFDSQRLRRVPAWAESSRYTIEATTDHAVALGPTDGRSAAVKIMKGPMLQTLLEERFRLRTHREAEEVPMYALTVANSGLKLKPMEAGGCTPLDPAKRQEPFAPGQKPLCISHLGFDGPNWKFDSAGRRLSNLAMALSAAMDRHVIDKTGVEELYILHLTFARDENAPGNDGDRPSPDAASGPSVFTALDQQLGLRLVPDRGLHESIVIDHVEKPSGN